MSGGAWSDQILCGLATIEGSTAWLSQAGNLTSSYLTREKPLRLHSYG